MTALRQARVAERCRRIVASRPFEVLIVVVIGGFGRHSSWLPTFGDTTRSVTKPVCRADGTPVRTVLELKQA